MSALSIEEKTMLVEKLLACPSCDNRSGRDSLLSQLPESFRHAIKLGVTSNGKQDVTAIIDACLECENGLDALLKVVAVFDGGTNAFGELQSYASGLSGVAGALTKIAKVNVPPRNSRFVGRERELKEMYDVLLKSSTVPITALHGLGGVGKTSLVLEYIYRHEAAYNFIAWLPAETHTVLEEAFLKLARPLGMLVLSVDAATGERAQKIEDIKTELTKRGKGWLLVFDDAEKAETIAAFQPECNSYGHILITTRNRQLGMLGQPVSVDVLTEADALTLMASYCTGASVRYLAGKAEPTWRDEQEKKDALSLVNELGCLALAVKQAGSYIYSCQCTVSDYLVEFKRVRLELFGEGFAKPQDYHATVATTWQVSFDSLRKQNVGAADFLNLLAFFSPEAIRLEWFTNKYEDVRENLPKSVRELTDGLGKLNVGLAALLQYSLVSRNGGEIQVHHLVQMSARDQLLQEKINLSPDDENDTANEVTAYSYWLNIAVGFLLTSFPDEKDYRQWDACAKMLSHVESVLACYQKQVAKCGDKASFEACWKDTDLNLQRQNLLFTKAARYYEKRGFYAQARPYYETALALSEQVHGPEHRETATTLNNLALLLKSQGEYETARPLYERALAISEKVLGPDHLSTATTLNNLALLLQLQGEYETARSLHERALGIREKVLGPDHPDTATTINNLAWLLYVQGEYETARPLCERVLSIREKVLGAEHPDTAQSLNNLAGLLYAQGEYEMARPLYERDLAISEKVLGAEHPDTATSLNNLAVLLYKMGELETAFAMFRRALAIRWQKLGKTHPYTNSTAQDLAIVETKLDKHR